MKIIGVILAAGKGKRMNSKSVNKTTLKFNGRSLISYGVDLFKKTADKTIVVVGAYSQSVRDNLKNMDLIFAEQTKRLGTGHAVKIAMKEVRNLSADIVLIGYGDHMMYYSTQLVKNLIDKHVEKKAAITLISTLYEDPKGLGRIVRNEDGDLERIVEEKDATKNERMIKEINAGFYCFDNKFLTRNISKLKKSHITGEYYLTDLIQMAKEQNLKVVPLKVPYEEVGIGVNTPDQLEQSKELYTKTHL